MRRPEEVWESDGLCGKELFVEIDLDFECVGMLRIQTIDADKKCKHKQKYLGDLLKYFKGRK